MQVRWKNLKTFADTDWINLAPLTLLIGANNTGKSSLYAPLLLLKQTQMSKSARPGLILRGDYFDAGTFGNLVRDHDETRSIEFHFRLTPDDKTAFANQTEDEDDQDVDHPADLPHPTELGLSFRPNGHDVDLDSYTVKDEDGQVLLSRRRTRNGQYTIAGPVWRDTAKAATSLENNPAIDHWRRRIRQQRPINFLFRGTDPIHYILYQSGIPSTELRSTDVHLLVSTIVRFNLLMDTVGRAVFNQLNAVSYLGPIRAEPRRYYELSGERPASVGTRGQTAPEVLFRSSEDDALKQRVERWLARFGLGDTLRFVDCDPELFSLHLRPRAGGPYISFADAGFGASQLLPIIVEWLNSRDTGLVITEQPEIHLNPRLQALLGDLLLEIPNSGRTAIVETHSEHLLMRIRTLVAMKRIPAHDVAIYFTETTPAGSRLRCVPLKENGGIDQQDWPSDFFAESLTQAFDLASAQADRSLSRE